MPKGINADGSPKKPPTKPQKPHKVKGPYKFALDIVAQIEKQPNATAYLEALVRKDIASSSIQETKEHIAPSN